jgi:hypothetical protein
MKRARRKAPLLAPANRADLRDWLEANHRDVDRRCSSSAEGHHRHGAHRRRRHRRGLCFGWIDSTGRRLDATASSCDSPAQARWNMGAHQQGAYRAADRRGLHAPAG